MIPEYEELARLERSPKGGLHIFMKEDVTSKSGVLIKGVADIKGAKAYFLVAPSKGYKHINKVERPWKIVGSARDMAVPALRAKGYEAEGKEGSSLPDIPEDGIKLHKGEDRNGIIRQTRKHATPPIQKRRLMGLLIV